MSEKQNVFWHSCWWCEERIETTRALKVMMKTFNQEPLNTLMVPDFLLLFFIWIQFENYKTVMVSNFCHHFWERNDPVSRSHNFHGIKFSSLFVWKEIFILKITQVWWWKIFCSICV
jgi:hypothetical protein